MLIIKLTEKESEIWNWAADAAIDYWNQDEKDRDDGLKFKDDPLTYARNLEARIINHTDVIEDMIYRLSEQLPDMVEDVIGTNEQSAALKDLTTAGRVVKKLEAIKSKVINT